MTEDDRSKTDLYNKVYAELGAEFIATAHELVHWLDAGAKNCTTKEQQARVLSTRLVSTAVGYFSRQLCGMDTPKHSWPEAIALILRHPNAIDPMPLHCRHHKICPFYSNLLVDPTAADKN